MPIDSSSILKVRTIAAMLRPMPPTPRARRTAAALLSASPLHLALLALVVLLAGIGLSIISTTDPQWWRLHFSRLGTFRDSSGAAFNVTLIVGGSLVALFAHAVGRELRRHERRHVRRGAAMTARILLTGVGVNLALVGCVPLNVNQFVHDHVAAGMVVSFALLLVASPVLMHRMPKRLLATTAIVFAYLFCGGWLFVSATINLALFEVIGFSAMFAWSGVFVICLTRVTAAAAASPEGAAAVSSTPADAVESLSPSADDAAGGCSGPVPRRPRPVSGGRRPRRTPARPAWRRAARALPPRGCTAPAAPAASAR